MSTLVFGTVATDGSVAVSGSGNWTPTSLGTGLYEVDIDASAQMNDNTVILCNSYDTSSDGRSTDNIFTPYKRDIDDNEFEVVSLDTTNGNLQDAAF